MQIMNQHSSGLLILEVSGIHLVPFKHIRIYIFSDVSGHSWPVYLERAWQRSNVTFSGGNTHHHSCDINGASRQSTAPEIHAQCGRGGV